jgi:hypothetical protein
MAGSLPHLCSGCVWVVVGTMALLVLRGAMKTLSLFLDAWLDAKKLLADVRPPSDAKIEAFVPFEYRRATAPPIAPAAP